MALSSATTFICDRCAIQSAPVDGPPPNMAITPPPDDWLQMQTSITPAGGIIQQQHLVLCIQCTSAFNAFLAAGKTAAGSRVAA
jgi:hypothetical protein